MQIKVCLLSKDIFKNKTQVKSVQLGFRFKHFSFKFHPEGYGCGGGGGGGGGRGGEVSLEAKCIRS